MLQKLFDIERLIHSFKTALACIIGVVVIKFAHIQSGQWVMISIVIVMCAQINVGSLVQKSYLRLAGTLLGCAIAILALTFFGYSEIVVISSIAIAAFFFSYAATAQDAFINLGTLGAATTAIIMATPHPTVTLATDRFIEISIGIVIAALVSQFILPIHARTHLLRAQAKTLTLLREFYLMRIATPPFVAPIDYLESDEEIAKMITKQRQLSKDAVREPLGIFFDRQQFTHTLLCEKEILRSIDFMHNALFHLKQYPDFAHSPILKYLNDTIPKAFNALVNVMENEDVSTIKFEIPAIKNLKLNIAQTFKQHPREEALYIDGFLFSAEILVKNLSRLAKLFNLPIAEVEMSS